MSDDINTIALQDQIAVLENRIAALQLALIQTEARGLTGPVNVGVIIVTHRPQNNSMAITATSPYLEEQLDNSAPLPNALTLLVQYFNKITAPPTPEEGTSGVHPIYGEWNATPSKLAEEEIRVPDKKLVLER